MIPPKGDENFHIRSYFAPFFDLIMIPPKGDENNFCTLAIASIIHDLTMIPPKGVENIADSQVVLEIDI